MGESVCVRLRVCVCVHISGYAECMRVLASDLCPHSDHFWWGPAQLQRWSVHSEVSRGVGGA